MSRGQLWEDGFGVLEKAGAPGQEPCSQSLSDLGQTSSLLWGSSLGGGWAGKRSSTKATRE